MKNLILNTHEHFFQIMWNDSLHENSYNNFHYYTYNMENVLVACLQAYS